MAENLTSEQLHSSKRLIQHSSLERLEQPSSVAAMGFEAAMRQASEAPRSTVAAERWKLMVVGVALAAAPLSRVPVGEQRLVRPDTPGMYVGRYGSCIRLEYSLAMPDKRP